MNPLRPRSAFGQILGAFRLKRGSPAAPILFRRAQISPELNLTLRLCVIVGLFAAAFAVFWWDREGLRDNLDGHITFGDVVYFTMVTVTTVGYGDIVPVSDRARLIDAIFVTPIRIIIWFLFLGTAYQLLVRRVIEDLRMKALQRKISGHIILLGFGGSGATAAGELLAQGIEPDQIVVVDKDELRVRAAADAGLTGLHGEVTREELLRIAGAERARAAIIAVGRDDTTVLTVLTLRHVNPTLRIVATVNDSENRKLLRGSGADFIVAPYQVGGFLLADAVTTDTAVHFLTDLLSCVGEVSLVERPAKATEIGKSARQLTEVIPVAIQRGGLRIPFWKDAELVIREGDVLLAITHSDKPTEN